MTPPIVIKVGAVNQEGREALIECAKAVPRVSDACVSGGNLVVTAGAGVIAADVMAALACDGLHWITGSVDPE